MARQLITDTFTSPSVLITQLIPLADRAIMFRCDIDPLDLVNPAKSMRISHEIAVDQIAVPDNLLIWTEDCAAVWVGNPDTVPPLLGTYGIALQGKRLRTKLTVIGQSVTAGGSHEIVAIPSPVVIG